MSDKVHWVVPGAALPPSGNAGAWAARSADLPNLRALLAAMVPAGRISCAEDSPAMPYEMLLAQLNGLPGDAGHVPWAAFESGTVGTPCAWIKLCHWQVGRDHVLLTPPEDLNLDEDMSRAFMAAMEPYFLEDGITLCHLPGLAGGWLATGEAFRGLATTSLDRAVGVPLTRSFFEAAGAPAATLRRLQNEMQMLLYTDAANDLREQRGLPPVNSFWVTGAGVLDRPVTPAPGVFVEPRLQGAARRHDAAAHASAWKVVDADLCASLLALLKAGTEVHLSLCGERAVQTLAPAPAGLWPRLARTFNGGVKLQILDDL